MSLNDVLYKRPYLLPTLFDLLLKFSVKPTAITVDIERAFSQIVVDENHRGLVTFMQYKNPLSSNISSKTYQFIRIIFGVTCSPFLLNGTLQEHGKDYEQIDKPYADVISSKFCVDNLNTGVNDVSEGHEKLFKCRMLSYMKMVH